MTRVPRILVAALVLAASATAVLAPPQDKPGRETQDKVPAPPKGQEGKRLVPVVEPAHTPGERRDLLQRFRGRHAIEGFYRLRHMNSAGGQAVRGARGYLVIGQRHLSIHLYAPGTNEQVNIQAAFRKFRIAGNRLVMSSLVGHRNKANGDVGVEPIGFATEHRFLLAGSVLRLFQSQEEYLEFERIE